MYLLSINQTLAKRIIILFLAALFFILDFSYKTYLSTVHAHWNYVYAPDLVRSLQAVMTLAAFLFFFLRKRMTDFMLFANTLVFVWFVDAALVMYKNHPAYSGEILSANLFFASLMLFFGDKRIPLPIKSIDDKAGYGLSLFLGFVIPVYIVFKLGNIVVDFGNPLNFLREQAHVRQNLFDGFSKPLLYLFNWSFKVFLPFVIIKSVKKRKWSIVAAALAVTLVLYVYTNVRFVLFAGAASLFFAFFGDHRKSAVVLAAGLAIAGLAGILMRYTVNVPAIESLIIRRMIMVPQLHNIAYFDLFKDFHLHLSYSNFVFWEKNPLPVSPARWVGETFYHRPGLLANNGFISQGFMDFGYLGIVLYSLIVAGIFLFFNSLKINARYNGLVVLLFFSLISSSLNTVLITHGGLLIMLMLYFFAEKD